jgi:hypothetical protein
MTTDLMGHFINSLGSTEGYDDAIAAEQENAALLFAGAVLDIASLRERKKAVQVALAAIIVGLVPKVLRTTTKFCYRKVWVGLIWSCTALSTLAAIMAIQPADRFQIFQKGDSLIRDNCSDLMDMWIKCGPEMKDLNKIVANISGPIQMTDTRTIDAVRMWGHCTYIANSLSKCNSTQ